MRAPASEAGFTLADVVVALGITAILLTAGAVWMLGSHPGGLATATGGYDSALASARAIAATSGNGATLAFLPRTDRSHELTGFTLRVFVGRPTSASAVRASTAMPLVANARVVERTLGTPPFSIFIGASGDVSGASAYPAIDSHGQPRFDPIPNEPPCPKRGLELTFADAQHDVTRTLPCATSVESPRLPNPSPTPNVPLVTPLLLQYHWPADARQTFVATEWGYTHWFATTSAFACGDSIARYPDVLPSPYSPPNDPQEAEATPSPPARTPYSYPNSGGASMNDAPAAFPLEPVREGLCSATVADDRGQLAGATVQVMGWLTALYGGRTYTHVSKRALTLPATTFPKKGSSVTVSLAKTYDAQPLHALVAFDPACLPYLSYASVPGKTPPSPGPTPATAAVTMTLVTIPGSKTQCGGVIYDQYARSLGGEGIPFNATLGEERCADRGNTWKGPSDGSCYDLYFIPTGTTQTGGWTEESEMGLYASHGTPGNALYAWVVNDGSCYLQNVGGTGFAQWTVLLGNGDPTPPPVASPQPMQNAAGFGVTYVPNTIAVTSAPDPNPTKPPFRQCGTHGHPTPTPP